MKRRTKEVELRLTLFVFFNFLYAKKLSFEKEGRCSTNAGKNSVKFTDKVPFLTDLSVKLGAKRLKSYGQTAVFAHFVRNRLFSSRPITDKTFIFIDVSVNGSGFAKCIACSSSMLSHQANLPPNYFRIFPSCQLLVTHTQNPGLDLRLIANHPGVQFETDFFQASF